MAATAAVEEVEMQFGEVSGSVRAFADRFASPNRDRARRSRIFSLLQERLEVVVVGVLVPEPHVCARVS